MVCLPLIGIVATVCEQPANAQAQLCRRCSLRYGILNTAHQTETPTANVRADSRSFPNQ